MQWRHSLVLSWCLALPSLGGRWCRFSLGGRWCFFGGVEADSSPEEYHFRGDRTQNDEDISRSLTLKPSIYIHDLSEIIFMYTVHPCTPMYAFSMIQNGSLNLSFLSNFGDWSLTNCHF